MGPRSRIALISLAAVSAAVWAYGMVVLQPLSEPGGPDAYGSNNTYWARELRWGALIALLVAVLAQAGGSRRALRVTVAGATGWLAADLVLDRIDPGSGTVALAAGGAVAALV